ncbi:MAG: hypothetical protein MJE66_23660 [Proteobacteria bacterium]|nr:hypothetical protein [Pseudomonadota bacterium]
MGASTILSARIARAAIGLLALVGLAACGDYGGDSSSGGGGGGGASAELASVAGVWDLEITEPTTNCPGELAGGFERFAGVNMTQNGTSVSFLLDDTPVEATLSGRRLALAYSQSEGGGQTSHTGEVSVSPNGSTLSGTTRWEYTDSATSCSGEHRWEGQFVSDAGFQGNLTVQLDWSGSQDLDLLLVTPTGVEVTVTQGGEGCVHQGDDVGSASGGREEIRCTSIIPGSYAVRVRNVSPTSANFQVRSSRDGSTINVSNGTVGAASMANSVLNPAQSNRIVFAVQN